MAQIRQGEFDRQNGSEDMIVLEGAYNKAIVYTDIIEETAKKQVEDLCNQPFLKDVKIRMMPDLHAGKGCTVGTTMTVTDKIVPNFVGVDLGCGMICVKLDVKKEEIDFENLDRVIRSEVPSGMNVRKSAHENANQLPFDRILMTRLSKNGRPVYHFSALACFADHCVVPQECCVPFVKTVPLAVAALIGCAVTTGVGAVLNTARVKPGSSVAVFGAGGVGLSIIMGARLAGASRIIAVDRAPAKLDLARSFGATDALLAGPEATGAIRGAHLRPRRRLCVRGHRHPGRAGAVPGRGPAGRRGGAGRHLADGQRHQPAGGDHHPPGEDHHGHLLRQRQHRPRLPAVRRAVPARPTAAGPAGFEDLPAGADQRGLCRYAGWGDRAGRDCV